MILAADTLGSFYIWRRATQGFQLRGKSKWIFTAVFVFVSLAYVLRRVLQNNGAPYYITEVFDWVGSFWIALLLYYFLTLLALDIVRLINIGGKFLPPKDSPKYPKLRRNTAWFIALGVMLTVFIGHMNSRIVNVRPLEMTIDKPMEYDSLVVVAAADFHMGSIIGPARTQQYVDKINAENADLVIIAGDIVDGDIEPVERQNLGPIVQTIRSKYGVYGIMGNHEYFGGGDPSAEYLHRHGIYMLRDTVVEVAGLYIMGREDRSGERRTGRKRKTIAELKEGLDMSKPLLMMDHQPYNLEDADTNKIDFQLSGHSHHGQMWPINHITDAVYEVSWGYKKKKNTHVYVTCGAGTWGPPVRLASTPEIMRIVMRFPKKR
jgi:predicted MPP superfamily phosphohydrolase